MDLHLVTSCTNGHCHLSPFQHPSGEPGLDVVMCLVHKRTFQHLQQMLLSQLFHSIFFIAYGKFSALSFKNCIFVTFPFNISVRGSAAVLLTAGKGKLAFYTTNGIVIKINQSMQIKSHFIIFSVTFCTTLSPGLQVIISCHIKGTKNRNCKSHIKTYPVKICSSNM